MEDKSLEKEDRVEVEILIMNGTYTFDEVMKELDAGETVSYMLPNFLRKNQMAKKSTQKLM